MRSLPFTSAFLAVIFPNQSCDLILMPFSVEIEYIGSELIANESVGSEWETSFVINGFEMIPGESLMTTDARKVEIRATAVESDDSMDDVGLVEGVRALESVQRMD